MTPRRFLLCRGNRNIQVEVLTVDELTEAIGEHVLMYDTAEMLSHQAWAGRKGEHGYFTVEPRE